MIIAEAANEITCDAAGPPGGPYAGWITYWQGGEPTIEPLLATGEIYATPLEAQQAMVDLVNTIRREGPIVPGVRHGS
jgi:hypothetical protein